VPWIWPFLWRNANINFTHTKGNNCPFECPFWQGFPTEDMCLCVDAELNLNSTRAYLPSVSNLDCFNEDIHVPAYFRWLFLNGRIGDLTNIWTQLIYFFLIQKIGRYLHISYTKIIKVTLVTSIIIHSNAVLVNINVILQCRPCEAAAREVQIMKKKYKEEDDGRLFFDGGLTPNCSPDGFFSKVK